MDMHPHYDMIVIGGGPCGYTAALYGARSGLHILVLEKITVGGQMALTTQIDNYPGYPEGVDGTALGNRMRAGAERFGAETKITEVLSAALNGEAKTVETADGVFCGKTIVIATGASHKELGIAHEQALVGRGISYCAHCDGMLYRGKTVVVVGGGNTAAADALLLSGIAKKVILVHRSDALRASQIYHKPLMNAENVELMWNSTVTALHFDDFLTGIRVRNSRTGEEKQISCDGLFVCIGRKPASELFQGQLELDESGYIVADETTKTSIPGVFAAGDVRTKTLRQIITAASDGAVAAHYAEQYLKA